MELPIDLRVDVDSHLAKSAKELGIEFRDAKIAYDRFWKDFARLMGTEEIPIITITNLGSFRPHLPILHRVIGKYSRMNYVESHLRLLTVLKRLSKEKARSKNPQRKNYREINDKRKQS